jgi:hypothetical protein
MPFFFNVPLNFKTARTCSERICFELLAGEFLQSYWFALADGLPSYPMEARPGSTVVVLSTTQATFLLNAGITSIHYLSVFYTFAIWQICAYLRDKKPLNLALSIAGALPLVLLKNRPSEADPLYLDPLLTIIPTFVPWIILGHQVPGTGEQKKLLTQKVLLRL